MSVHMNKFAVSKSSCFEIQLSGFFKLICLKKCWRSFTWCCFLIWGSNPRNPLPVRNCWSEIIIVARILIMATCCEDRNKRCLKSSRYATQYLLVISDIHQFDVDCIICSHTNLITYFNRVSRLTVPSTESEDSRVNCFAVVKISLLTSPLKTKLWIVPVPFLTSI